MPVGLQVFSPSGKLRLEITDRLTRHIGSFSFPPWNDATSRFISVPGMADDGHWVVTYDPLNYYHRIGNEGVTVFSTYPYAMGDSMGINTATFTVYRT